MLLHLVGSSGDMQQDYPFLKAIIDAVQDCGSDLVRNWVDAANHRMIDRGTPYADAEWEAIMDENMAALASADAIIVEGTHNRFSQGYQMANALQMDKPVLLLNRPAPVRSFSGVKHKLLTKQQYSNQQEISAQIAEFIKKY